MLYPFIKQSWRSKKPNLTNSVTTHKHLAYDIGNEIYSQASGGLQKKSAYAPADTFTTGTISFHHISYTLDKKSAIFPWRRIFSRSKSEEEPKQVLHDVSGTFKIGMNAIMGPTGSGKSTLLDVLAHRKDSRNVSGQILVDGMPPPDTFKQIVGYVIQNDIMCELLTVRENLMFSANLRMPNNMPLESRKEKVEQIIVDFGLQACADTRIGTEFVRGISGGEKRRTSIAMEMVLSPKILFLDEPTTGLDAATAQTVMECLSTLSKNGHNIIFSIHQPRYSIFKLFDTVTLICDGDLIYHDKAKLMLDYFARQGYTCEAHDNPADFAIDVLIQASKVPKKLERLKHAYIKSSAHGAGNFIKQNFIHENSQNISSHTSREQQRSRARESYYVVQRTLINTIRDPSLFLTQLIVAVFLGLLVGLVFYDLKYTVDTGVPDRIGAITVIVIIQLFSTLGALEPLIKQRALFIHEYMSNYYRISTYFFAKLTCEVMLIRIIATVIFSIIAYFMLSLQRDVGRFFVFIITAFLGSLFPSILCFWLSAAIPVYSVSATLFSLIFLIMMIFSGVQIALTSIFSWLSWLQWFSVFRYTFNMLLMSEFRNIKFCLANATNICPVTGLDVLEARDLSYKTDWDLWKNYFALFMLTLGMLLLALIQLYRTKKTK